MPRNLQQGGQRHTGNVPIIPGYDPTFPTSTSWSHQPSTSPKMSLLPRPSPSAWFILVVRAMIRGIPTSSRTCVVIRIKAQPRPLIRRVLLHQAIPAIATPLGSTSLQMMMTHPATFPSYLKPFPTLPTTSPSRCPMVSTNQLSTLRSSRSMSTAKLRRTASP